VSYNVIAWCLRESPIEGSMSRYNQEELNEMAYKNWKAEAKCQISSIKNYVAGGQVKFEDVEELGYEIKDFISTAEEWDEGDLIYDYTVQAKQMLEAVPFSCV